ncbi:GNAT family protein [Zhihengliuella sp.]|uniref:GNAT family N-acetyltransferase n=1 Tax=Zhihengliuella sp. TaxID=1954483 RepID=UPI00281177BA|nr:GNAT family protein [Zhihengliuella sp.]
MSRTWPWEPSVAWWPATLEHGDLVLRPLRWSDASAWADLRRRNQDWLRPWDATDPDGGTRPTFRHMVFSLNRQARAGHCLPWAIAVRPGAGAEPVLAGQVTVSTITWGAAKSCSIGYWIDAGQAGRGLVPQAVALAGDFVFGTLGLHRVEINIRPENAASLRVVEKLAFRDEGLRERFLHINGAWADHRTFALTREDVAGSFLERLQSTTM